LFEGADDDFLEDVLEEALNLFHMQIVPPRSHPNTFVTNVSSNYIENATKKIEYLRGKPQPDQRTPEWYSFRHNLITASNAYKAFENETTRNQLIFEKCQPLIIEPEKSTC
jgi:hypothetical protein